MSPKRPTMASITLSSLRLRSSHIRLWMSDTTRFEYPSQWLQRCLIVTRLVPRKTAAVSAQVLCTSYNYVYIIQPCTSLQCYFIRSHIRRMHVCLALACHLYFWQKKQDYLHATAVTRRWNGYQNERQHRRSDSMLLYVHRNHEAY